MGNKLDGNQAKLKAYDSLIQTFQKALDEYINDYNAEMIRQAMQNIEGDLKEHKCNIDLKIAEENDLQTIESKIEQCAMKLKALKESKERNVE
jgi:hypothetical protein